MNLHVAVQIVGYYLVPGNSACDYASHCNMCVALKRYEFERALPQRAMCITNNMQM